MLYRCTIQKELQDKLFWQNQDKRWITSAFWCTINLPESSIYQNLIFTTDKNTLHKQIYLYNMHACTHKYCFRYWNKFSHYLIYCQSNITVKFVRIIKFGMSLFNLKYWVLVLHFMTSTCTSFLFYQCFMCIHTECI